MIVALLVFASGLLAGVLLAGSRRPRGFFRTVAGELPRWRVDAAGEQALEPLLALCPIDVALRASVEEVVRSLTVEVSPGTFDAVGGQAHGYHGLVLRGTHLRVAGGSGWERRLARGIAHAARVPARGSIDPQATDVPWFAAAQRPWVGLVAALGAQEGDHAAE